MANLPRNTVDKVTRGFCQRIEVVVEADGNFLNKLMKYYSLNIKCKF
jgi:hypothetical protein